MHVVPAGQLSLQPEPGIQGLHNLLASAYDSRAYPRHTAVAAAVASFRTWRSSRRAVAWGPAIICTCKREHAEQGVFRLQKGY